MKVLNLTDPGDTLETRMGIDEASGMLHFEEKLPASGVQEILDLNHAQRREGPPKGVEGRHVARVPLPLRAEWRKEWETKASRVMSWQEFLARKFTNPDFTLLLTGAKRGGIVHRR